MTNTTILACIIKINVCETNDTDRYAPFEMITTKKKKEVEKCSRHTPSF